MTLPPSGRRPTRLKELVEPSSVSDRLTVPAVGGSLTGVIVTGTVIRTRAPWPSSASTSKESLPLTLAFGV